MFHLSYLKVDKSKRKLSINLSQVVDVTGRNLISKASKRGNSLFNCLNQIISAVLDQNMLTTSFKVKYISVKVVLIL